MVALHLLQICLFSSSSLDKLFDDLAWARLSAIPPTRQLFGQALGESRQRYARGQLSEAVSMVIANLRASARQPRTKIRVSQPQSLSAVLGL